MTMIPANVADGNYVPPASPEDIDPGQFTPGPGDAVLTYDVWNRLKTYTKDGVTTTYSYDGDGKRIAKVTGNNRTEDVWDGMDLAGEVVFLEDRRIATGYVYGPDGILFAKKFVNGDYINEEYLITYEINSHGDVTACANRNSLPNILHF